MSTHAVWRYYEQGAKQKAYEVEGNIMGRVKDEWLEDQERGWSAPDTFVCSECVGDEYLAGIVESNLSEKCCSYCNRCENEPIAAGVEHIMPYIANTFYHYFAEPSIAGLPRDSGEWVGENMITDTENAFLSFGWFCHDDLFEDICNAFYNDFWFPCSGGWWLGINEHDRRRYAWEGFVQLTKHKMRYFFSDFKSDDSEEMEGYSPAKILEIIGHDIKKFSLLKEISSIPNLYRVRKLPDDATIDSIKELGPPPSHLSTAGRMNPPGISYGYFACSKRTAVLEVADTPPSKITIGSFGLRNPILAVDLTTIPKTPSIFNVDERYERDALNFLESFVAAIAAPVNRNGRQHFDYVPSQIVCEYLYQKMNIGKDKRIEALLYPSSLDPGGVNLVLFPPRSVIDDWETLLHLRSSETITYNNWNDFQREFLS